MAHRRYRVRRPDGETAHPTLEEAEDAARDGGVAYDYWTQGPCPREGCEEIGGRGGTLGETWIRCPTHGRVTL